ncbi:MAG: hypothetical protein ACQEP1_01200 [Nanobdellota archaeon]
MKIKYVLPLAFFVIYSAVSLSARSDSSVPGDSLRPEKEHFFAGDSNHVSRDDDQNFFVDTTRVIEGLGPDLPLDEIELGENIHEDSVKKQTWRGKRPKDLPDWIEEIIKENNFRYTESEDVRDSLYALAKKENPSLIPGLPSEIYRINLGLSERKKGFSLDLDLGEKIFRLFHKKEINKLSEKPDSELVDLANDLDVGAWSYGLPYRIAKGRAEQRKKLRKKMTLGDRIKLIFDSDYEEEFREELDNLYRKARKYDEDVKQGKDKRHYLSVIENGKEEKKEVLKEKLEKYYINPPDVNTISGLRKALERGKKETKELREEAQGYYTGSLSAGLTREELQEKLIEGKNKDFKRKFREFRTETNPYGEKIQTYSNDTLAFELAKSMGVLPEKVGIEDVVDEKSPEPEKRKEIWVTGEIRTRDPDSDIRIHSRKVLYSAINEYFNGERLDSLQDVRKFYRKEGELEKADQIENKINDVLMREWPVNYLGGAVVDRPAVAKVKYVARYEVSDEGLADEVREEKLEKFLKAVPESSDKFLYNK